MLVAYECFHVVATPCWSAGDGSKSMMKLTVANLPACSWHAATCLNRFFQCPLERTQVNRQCGVCHRALMDSIFHRWFPCFMAYIRGFHIMHQIQVSLLSYFLVRFCCGLDKHTRKYGRNSVVSFAYLSTCLAVVFVMDGSNLTAAYVLAVSIC
jgi:hypothetical protein